MNRRFSVSRGEHWLLSSSGSPIPASSESMVALVTVLDMKAPPITNLVLSCPLPSPLGPDRQTSPDATLPHPEAICVAARSVPEENGDL